MTTGLWSKAALTEAQKMYPPSGVGNNVVDFVELNSFDRPELKLFRDLPAPRANVPASALYTHYCDNETVHGVEFPTAAAKQWFESGSASRRPPLIADMSSNFGTRPVDWIEHDIAYAGAQKNVGPAGVCIVVIRKQLLVDLRRQRDPSTSGYSPPTLFDWPLWADAPSKLYNTPACYPLYVCGLNLDHMIRRGGLAQNEADSALKSRLVYDAIDHSGGFYTNAVHPNARSRVNIPFRISGGDAKMEEAFLALADSEGLLELKGHRAVGGCRASLYTAMPVEGAEVLTRLMKRFRDEHRRHTNKL